MLVDKNKSVETFKPVSKELLEYLKVNGVVSKEYINFLKETNGGFFYPNIYSINDEEYSVDILLGKSDEEIYDLIESNNLMKIDIAKIIVIGYFIGDDIICMKPYDDSIYFCALDDIEAKKLVKIADSFNSFLDKIKIIGD